MTEAIRIVDPSESMRLQEIGELTALAYLADSLLDASSSYVPQLRDAAGRASEAVLLAVADGEVGEGRIVGTITLVPPGSRYAEVAKDGEYELRMLAVSPIERGRGLGAMLTQGALDLAVERGARKVVLSTLETMTRAHRLYERLGFSRTPELDSYVIDNPDGTTTIVGPEEALSCAQPGVKILGYSWEYKA